MEIYTVLLVPETFSCSSDEICEGKEEIYNSCISTHRCNFLPACVCVCVEDACQINPFSFSSIPS